MKSKIKVLMLVIGLVSTSLLMANVNKGGFGMFEKMAEVLELTETQKTQIAPIVEKYKAQAEALRGQEFEDRSEKHAAMKNIMEAAKTEITPFLTTEQVEKLAELKGRHGRRGHHGKHRGNKELKQEMKAYFKSEILPIAKVKRQELDAVISQEDQQKIEKIRTKLNAEKAAHKAQKEAHRAERKEGIKGQAKGEGRTGQCEGKGKGHCKGKSEAYRAIKEEGKVLLDKYKGDIEPLLEGMKAEHGETWKTGMRAIVEKHEPEMSEHFDKFGKKGFGRHLKPFAFLMLDPNNNEWEDLEENPTPNKRAINVFPNPAVNNTTVEYEVTKAGMVNIGVYNRKGDLIKNVFEQNQQPGQYSVEVDLNNLDDQMYIIRVTDATGQVSKTVMKR